MTKQSKPDRQDGEGLLPPYSGPITIDAALLHALWCYGNLRPILGVVYSYGTHQKALDEADRLIRMRAAPQPRDVAEGAGIECPECNQTLYLGETCTSVHCGLGNAVKAAPPKPAPDAMRSRSLSDDDLMAVIRACGLNGPMRITTIRSRWKDGIDIDEPSHDIRRLADILASRLSAPTTLLESCGCYFGSCRDPGLKNCREELVKARKVKSDAPVPPADGATATAENAVYQKITGPGVDALENRKEQACLSPPADGALEPFAWVVLSDVTGNTRMWTRNGDIAKAFAAKHLLECVELYATPPVRGDREAAVYTVLTKHYPQDATLDAAWQDLKEAEIFSK